MQDRMQAAPRHASAITIDAAQPLPRRKWALGGMLAAASAALVLGIGALAGGSPSSAWAQGPEGAPSTPAVGWGGAHHHGPHGGMFFGGRHLDRLLDKIDATPAQREQIKPIAEKSAADLKALHQEGRALHEQGIKLWAQPTIDAAAAERLRQQMLAHHDKVSKRLLQATLDVGNVLTPAQRAQIAEHLQKRHERMKERMQRHHERHGGPRDGAAPTHSQPPAAKE